MRSLEVERGTELGDPPYLTHDRIDLWVLMTTVCTNLAAHLSGLRLHRSTMRATYRHGGLAKE